MGIITKSLIVYLLFKITFASLHHNYYIKVLNTLILHQYIKTLIVHTNINTLIVHQCINTLIVHKYISTLILHQYINTLIVHKYINTLIVHKYINKLILHHHINTLIVHQYISTLNLSLTCPSLGVTPNIEHFIAMAGQCVNCAFMRLSRDSGTVSEFP